MKFTLRGSWQLGWIVSIVYFGAIVSMLLLSITWWQKSALLACCLVQYDIIMRQYVLLSAPAAIIALTHSHARSFILTTRAGQNITAELHYPLFITNQLIILNFVFAASWVKTAVIIMGGSMDEEELRKLRVALMSNYKKPDQIKEGLRIAE